MKNHFDALDAISDMVLRYRPSGKGKQHHPEIWESAFTFYEFFAGGGMVRAGLGSRWRCLFANDFDYKKSTSYRENWKGQALKTKDVGKLETSEIPGTASLIWASFPCQDLSLAGMGAGLRGDRSGTFWPFWKLTEQLRAEGRGPRILVLENVCGTLTSHEGKDFLAIAEALSGSGYTYGAVVIDAVEFVPHSRARLFIIAVAPDTKIPHEILDCEPAPFRHSKSLLSAHGRLSEKALNNWVWWNIPTAPKRSAILADLIEENPTSVKWHTPEKTRRLLAMMSPVNIKKVEEAKVSGEVRVGAIYKRTRHDAQGNKLQRAEIRFDNIAGCLRTSTGGSSRQLILVVRNGDIRSRLISSRETARLMGLPEEYKLPKNYNEAYHLTGDGVVVPVVRHLAESILEPILISAVAKSKKRVTASITPD